jgi:basic membrane protein A
MNALFKLSDTQAPLKTSFFWALIQSSLAVGICFALTTLGACTRSPVGDPTPSSGQTPTKEIRIGLVLDKGGKDDKSFNSAAFEGAMKAKKDFNAYVKYVEATDDNAFESILRSFSQKQNFDLIIAVGVSQVQALKKISAQFPNQRYALVDGEVEAPNVRSLLFQEHEGSFLVGTIAAQVSKTGQVGFIGGMDIPLIRRFQKGYEAGARWINPKIKVLSNFVGMTEDAWNNPARAKELGVSQYNAGVDVIFAAAGASGTGLFDAAEEMKKFAIGVDSNQDWLKPGFILTSMRKRVDLAVFSACQDAYRGSFSGGVFLFGLANNGVDYTVDAENEKILPLSVRKRTDEIRNQIIAGKIQVPDFYSEKKK